jgi:transposase
MAQSRSEEARLVERAHIILQAAQGKSNKGIAKTLSITRKTAGIWRGRYLARRQARPQDPVRSHLEDAPRSGGPDRITPEQYVDILALATQDPPSVGSEITHWSTRELARVAEELTLVKSISHSSVQRLLTACELKPHQVKEWMNRKPDPEFETRATRVKQVLADAVSESADPKHAVGSFDEKTGIQALERIVPDKPMRCGSPTKREVEYRRHGTLTLLAMMLVNLGEVSGLVLPDRTNPTTATVLHLCLGLLLVRGYERITLVLDQLNTHMCLEVVKVVALLCDLPEPAPERVATMEQRRTWLENPDKPIVLCFTPKHASWLNPIELWFGVLSRKVIRRGSFGSTEELKEKIERFMVYYNEKLAHPYRLRQLRSRNKAA